MNYNRFYLNQETPISVSFYGDIPMGVQWNKENKRIAIFRIKPKNIELTRELIKQQHYLAYNFN